MKRIIGLLVIFVTLAACGAVVEAQQAKKVTRIGYLSTTDPSRLVPRQFGWLCASWGT